MVENVLIGLSEDPPELEDWITTASDLIVDQLISYGHIEEWKA